MGGMKKFSIWILSSIIALVLLDVAFGKAFAWYVRNCNLNGEFRNLDYLVKDAHEDVIILGSSVALQDINPNILSDSLGMSVFNGAAIDESIAYHLAALKMLVAHHSPKIIIFGEPPYSYLSDETGWRINMLTPYYGLGFPYVDSVLVENEKRAPWLMKSSLYRLNREWFRMLLFNFVNPYKDAKNGFIGLPKVDVKLDYNDASFRPKMNDIREVQLREFAQICKEHSIKLIFCFPPVYGYSDVDFSTTEMHAQIQSIVNDCGGTFIDHLTSTPLSKDATLFYDHIHLNVEGATAYTKLLSFSLKQYK